MTGPASMGGGSPSTLVHGAQFVVACPPGGRCLVSLPGVVEHLQHLLYTLALLPSFPLSVRELFGACRLMRLPLLFAFGISKHLLYQMLLASALTCCITCSS